MYKLELCTDNIDDAIKYQKQVDQIEFCSFLDKEGLTPAIPDVIRLLNEVNLPIKIMLRNREGDFNYDSQEMKDMIQRALNFIDIGVDRFVFGALKKNRLAIEQVAEFAIAIYPAKVCVHKAIDLSESILEDAMSLLSIKNVNEVLTSGGSDTAEKGSHIISKMTELLKGKIDVIAAGKITYKNLDEVNRLINAPVYHGKNIIKMET